MSSKKIDDKKTTIEPSTRRGVLKKTGTSALAVVAASQLPANWKKPVVDSVLLPVHAQMSVGGGDDGGGGTTPSITTPAEPTTTPCSGTLISVTVTPTGTALICPQPTLVL